MSKGLLQIDRKENFTEQYRQQCRSAWYAAGKPDADVLRKLLLDKNITEGGRAPKTTTIRRWRKVEMWDWWAEDLDSRAMTIVEDDLVQQKAEMLRRQARAAEELQSMGMDYLRTSSFDSSSSAVQAVIRGAELERTSRGIGEMIVRMSKMSDEELLNEIIKNLPRANMTIIEGEASTEPDAEQEAEGEAGDAEAGG